MVYPRDEQLVDYIVEQKEQGNFNGIFMPTWAKTHGEQIIKLAKKLQQSGVDEIFGFSLQSTNPETLKNVKRKNTYDIQGFVSINLKTCRCKFKSLHRTYFSMEILYIILKKDYRRY